jgi:FLVCR family MFS transporter 7
MEAKNKVSRYRWVILISILPIIISTEMMWLSLAPISSFAQEFYGVDSISIDMMSISYMIMFILFSIPASWVVDKFGYRYSLIFGAVLTAVFGIVRAIWADDFMVVLIAQFIIAIGQPFLLNISTKVPANWFPVNERSSAAGILTMAQYIGFAVPMLLSPALADNLGIPGVLKIFAIVAVISAFISILFTREKPRIALPDSTVLRDDLGRGTLRKLIKNKSYAAVLVMCFISIGIFNTILTLLETILMPRGITSAQAGIIGAVFVVAGILGAVVLPMISDKFGTRVPFFVGSIVLLIPVYIGFTFVGTYILVLAIAGIAGFITMGVAPILFQHGSEVAYPVQEGTSLGIILLMGQISGAVMVYLFEALKNISGSLLLPMLLIITATVLELPIVLKMRESDIIRQRKEIK